MNLLITGAWADARRYIDSIENSGHSVMFMQNESDALPCSYEWVEGVICNGLFTAHPIEKFINLKYIQLTSSGLDRVPMDYVKSHNIKINNARGVYSIPMAEFAVAGVLTLYKQLGFFADNRKNRLWVKNRGLLELNGKTVCIIGTGSVGTECAIRFRAFGCHVVGINRRGRGNPKFDRVVSCQSLDDELGHADVVILSVPLTDDTYHMINSDRVPRMKKTSILVNISRGAVADENMLISALANGQIMGAVLDVFEEEPLGENSPIWDMDNVIVTPHNSFVGDGNRERLKSIILENLSE